MNHPHDEHVARDDEASHDATLSAPSRLTDSVDEVVSLASSMGPP